MKLMRRLRALAIIVVAASAASAQTRIAGRFGEANVGNRKVIVHVTVAVPPGLDDKQVGDDAVRGQGARPLEPAELTLNGLRWPGQYPVGPATVVQSYNPAGQAFATAGNELAAAQGTWTSVPSSNFAFQAGGQTNRCPSLVKECPGAQVFDGYNDVGWAAISGCCTLGVTWYSTSGPPEADMAINSRFVWNTTGAGGYDLQTVFLHENGHVVGLGHSTVSGSIMEATYAGVRRALTLDDVLGETYLYPEANAVADISGSVKDQSGKAITGAQVALSSLPVSATTDSTGAYLLAGIPLLATYTATASASGYQSVSQTDVQPPATANFTLSTSTPTPCRGRKCQ